jgi:hypothetical protein
MLWSKFALFCEKEYGNRLKKQVDQMIGYTQGDGNPNKLRLLDAANHLSRLAGMLYNIVLLFIRKRGESRQAEGGRGNILAREVTRTRSYIDSFHVEQGSRGDTTNLFYYAMLSYG